MKNRSIAMACIAALAFACNEKKETENAEEIPAAQEVVDNTATDVDSITPEAEAPSDKSAELAEGTQITVKGEITEINNGKDGYTAKIKMADGTVYFATISIPNLKDPKQYRKFNVGDVIKVKGKTFKIEEDTLIKVEELN
ncbi:OB-fold nucleic acid binding domain-containing protein [Flavobacterium sp. MFBS3-15]|uniref:OB-fold nucleic acid binding domain-containing protein n=1 Tax=Flavobacterium sp. MFBS3-15 TaxID=2989816 RepID=UPI002236B107|nr:OB-fold nucleic acid binding domain-containing protein [Flavobacterium sp. MFBS3-15]MCW4467688.1 OB-fold nucleic acid binding domain-containing protein [Flavobacterium sp. MFBS3-15]